MLFDNRIRTFYDWWIHFKWILFRAHLLFYCPENGDSFLSPHFNHSYGIVFKMILSNSLSPYKYNLIKERQNPISWVSDDSTALNTSLLFLCTLLVLVLLLLILGMVVKKITPPVEECWNAIYLLVKSCYAKSLAIQQPAPPPPRYMLGRSRQAGTNMHDGWERDDIHRIVVVLYILLHCKDWHDMQKTPMGGRSLEHREECISVAVLKSI